MGLQLLPFPFFGFFLFIHFLLPLILSCFLFMRFLLPLILYNFLFMCFLLRLISSYFSFTNFLLLWLCLVFSCISCRCGFARFHLALLSQNQSSSLSLYTRALWAFYHILGWACWPNLLSFLFIYSLHWVGHVDPFAFSSLHLYTTLGWACWPFYFLISLFIHYIGLDPLTLFTFFSGQNGPIPPFVEIFSKKTLFRK